MDTEERTELRRKSGTAYGTSAVNAEDRADARARSTEHHETGAFLADEMIERGERQFWMSADDYRPDATGDHVEEARRNDAEGGARDDRLSVGRLLFDVGTAAKLYTRGLSKDDRRDVAYDALLLLVTWDRQGVARFDLGPSGLTPRRRDWIDRDTNRPTAGACRAMRAALKQATEARNADAERHAEEISTDPTLLGVSLGSLAAAEAREEELANGDLAGSLPDLSPELLAHLLGVSLAAGRNLWHRAAQAVTDGWSIADSADLLGVELETFRDSLKRGPKDLAKVYPEPRDLLAALRAMRSKLAGRAALALTYWRDWPTDEEARADALEACADWRRVAPDSDSLTVRARVALDVAATMTIRRQRRTWSPEDGAHLAAQCDALLTAETRRAKSRARTSSVRSHLPGRSALPGRMVIGGNVGTVRPLTAPERWGMAALTIGDLAAVDTTSATWHRPERHVPTLHDALKADALRESAATMARSAATAAASRP